MKKRIDEYLRTDEDEKDHTVYIDLDEVDERRKEEEEDDDED